MSGKEDIISKMVFDAPASAVDMTLRVQIGERVFLKVVIKDGRVAAFNERDVRIIDPTGFKTKRKRQ